MSFRSLHHILGALQEQSQWQDQPFQRLLKYWPEAVGAAVTAHTRPISIQRSVLSVATSGAAWAQTLTFQRQHILEKLNPHLLNPLVDIRFSTAQWQRPQSSTLNSPQSQITLGRDHPSFLGVAPYVPNSIENSRNPNAAFQHWAKVMQARAYGLPLCPQCQCPTPQGELERWNVCSICITKQR